MSHIQIAIDGPSGAGKSSLSRAVAKAMGIIYVDTGALYRTVGYFARSKGITLENVTDLVPLLPEISIEVRYENDTQCVYLNGENLGDRIRENEISMYASKVSAIPAVRAFLLDFQRKQAREHNVVMDGRDIGTVVLPNADVKIFLTASPEARAQRRTLELVEKGQQADFDTILRDIIARDEQDANRPIAPLKQAEDAVLVDTTCLDLEQSLEALKSAAKEAVSL
jgi:cytidylate kinase